MKAYKGFRRNEDGTLSCRDFVYEPGKTYKHEGEIKLCKSGFHACHELWQTWLFYPNNGKNVFYEVECGGDIIEVDNSFGKLVCSEIKLVKEIDVTNVARFCVASYFYEGFARVTLGGKDNFINTEGKFLSDQWFDDARGFSSGFATVKLGNKWNYIDTEGKFLSDRGFDDAWVFSEGLAVVEVDKKYNFIDTEGKFLSDQWFDEAWSFSEGWAKVKLDGKWMIIDTEGNLLSKQQFDEARSLSEGLAMVKLYGKQTKINTRGEIVEE